MIMTPKHKKKKRPPFFLAVLHGDGKSFEERYGELRELAERDGLSMSAELRKLIDEAQEQK